MENTVIYDAIQNIAEQTEYNGRGIEALLNGRVVKSVQRGMFTFGSRDETSKVINISTINPSKSSIILAPANGGNSTANYTTLSALTGVNLTENTINLTRKSGAGFVGAFWQVIEFY